MANQTKPTSVFSNQQKSDLTTFGELTGDQIGTLSAMDALPGDGRIIGDLTDDTTVNFKTYTLQAKP